MHVPFPYPGTGRAVYPGFLQLSGFMAMNIDRHVGAHLEMFNHLVDGDGDSAEKHREFYDEYLAVMDLDAEFYLETVEKVFVEHALPKGNFMHRNELVDLTKIRRCGLMTVEGERDDISGVGQTYAAQTLCTNILTSGASITCKKASVITACSTAGGSVRKSFGNAEIYGLCRESLNAAFWQQADEDCESPLHRRAFCWSITHVSNVTSVGARGPEMGYHSVSLFDLLSLAAAFNLS